MVEGPKQKQLIDITTRKLANFHEGSRNKIIDAIGRLDENTIKNITALDGIDVNNPFEYIRQLGEQTGSTFKQHIDFSEIFDVLKKYNNHQQFTSELRKIDLNDAIKISETLQNVLPKITGLQGKEANIIARFHELIKGKRVDRAELFRKLLEKANNDDVPIIDYLSKGSKFDLLKEKVEENVEELTEGDLETVKKEMSAFEILMFQQKLMQSAFGMREKKKGKFLDKYSSLILDKGVYQKINELNIKLAELSGNMNEQNLKNIQLLHPELYIRGKQFELNADFAKELSTVRFIVGMLPLRLNLCHAFYSKFIKKGAVAKTPGVMEIGPTVGEFASKLRNKEKILSNLANLDLQNDGEQRNIFHSLACLFALDKDTEANEVLTLFGNDTPNYAAIKQKLNTTLGVGQTEIQRKLKEKITAGDTEAEDDFEELQNIGLLPKEKVIERIAVPVTFSPQLVTQLTQRKLPIAKHPLFEEFTPFLLKLKLNEPMSGETYRTHTNRVLPILRVFFNLRERRLLTPELLKQLENPNRVELLGQTGKILENIDDEILKSKNEKPRDELGRLILDFVKRGLTYEVMSLVAKESTNAAEIKKRLAAIDSILQSTNRTKLMNILKYDVTIDGTPPSLTFEPSGVESFEEQFVRTKIRKLLSDELDSFGADLEILKAVTLKEGNAEEARGFVGLQGSYLLPENMTDVLGNIITQREEWDKTNKSLNVVETELADWQTTRKNIDDRDNLATETAPYRARKNQMIQEIPVFEAEIKQNEKNLKPIIKKISQLVKEVTTHRNAVTVLKQLDSIATYIESQLPNFERKNVLAWLNRAGITVNANETVFDALVRSLKSKLSAEKQDNLGSIALGLLEFIDIIKANAPPGLKNAIERIVKKYREEIKVLKTAKKIRLNIEADIKNQIRGIEGTIATLEASERQERANKAAIEADILRLQREIADRNAKLQKIKEWEDLVSAIDIILKSAKMREGDVDPKIAGLETEKSRLESLEGSIEAKMKELKDSFILEQAKHTLTGIIEPRVEAAAWNSGKVIFEHKLTVREGTTETVTPVILSLAQMNKNKKSKTMRAFIYDALDKVVPNDKLIAATKKVLEKTVDENNWENVSLFCEGLLYLGRGLPHLNESVDGLIKDAIDLDELKFDVRDFDTLSGMLGRRDNEILQEFWDKLQAARKKKVPKKKSGPSSSPGTGDDTTNQPPSPPQPPKQDEKVSKKSIEKKISEFNGLPEVFRDIIVPNEIPKKDFDEIEKVGGNNPWKFALALKAYLVDNKTENLNAKMAKIANETEANFMKEINGNGIDEKEIKNIMDISEIEQLIPATDAALVSAFKLYKKAEEAWVANPFYEKDRLDEQQKAFKKNFVGKASILSAINNRYSLRPMVVKNLVDKGIAQGEAIVKVNKAIEAYSKLKEIRENLKDYLKKVPTVNERLMKRITKISEDMQPVLAAYGYPNKIEEYLSQLDKKDAELLLSKIEAMPSTSAEDISELNQTLTNLLFDITRAEGDPSFGETLKNVGNYLRDYPEVKMIELTDALARKDSAGFLWAHKNFQNIGRAITKKITAESAKLKTLGLDENIFDELKRAYDANPTTREKWMNDIECLSQLVLTLAGVKNLKGESVNNKIIDIATDAIIKFIKTPNAKLTDEEEATVRLALPWWREAGKRIRGRSMTDIDPETSLFEITSNEWGEMSADDRVKVQELLEKTDSLVSGDLAPFTESFEKLRATVTLASLKTAAKKTTFEKYITMSGTLRYMYGNWASKYPGAFAGMENKILAPLNTVLNREINKEMLDTMPEEQRVEMVKPNVAAINGIIGVSNSQLITALSGKVDQTEMDAISQGFNNVLEDALEELKDENPNWEIDIHNPSIAPIKKILSKMKEISNEKEKKAKADLTKFSKEDLADYGLYSKGRDGFILNKFSEKERENFCRYELVTEGATDGATAISTDLDFFMKLFDKLKTSYLKIYLKVLEDHAANLKVNDMVEEMYTNGILQLQELAGLKPPQKKSSTKTKTDEFEDSLTGLEEFEDLVNDKTNLPQHPLPSLPKGEEELVVPDEMSGELDERELKELMDLVKLGNPEKISYRWKIVCKSFELGVPPKYLDKIARWTSQKEDIVMDLATRLGELSPEDVDNTQEDEALANIDAMFGLNSNQLNSVVTAVHVQNIKLGEAIELFKTSTPKKPKK